MMAGSRDIQYLVLPDAANPYLLARVRWPDAFHAISAARPDWQADPGLFDLAYDPSGTTVTPDRAAAIAAAWGARLPADGTTPEPDASLIRRMPADWSNLSPAEKRAWSIQFVKTGRRRSAGKGSNRSRRRGRRSPEVIDLTGADDAALIDLTDTAAHTPATARARDDSTS